MTVERLALATAGDRDERPPARVRRRVALARGGDGRLQRRRSRRRHPGRPGRPDRDRARRAPRRLADSTALRRRDRAPARRGNAVRLRSQAHDDGARCRERADRRPSRRAPPRRCSRARRTRSRADGARTARSMRRQPRDWPMRGLPRACACSRSRCASSTACPPIPRSRTSSAISRCSGSSGSSIRRGPRPRAPWRCAWPRGSRPS